MCKVAGFDSILKEGIKAEYIPIYYPDSLVLYIIRGSICVKYSQNIRYSMD